MTFKFVDSDPTNEFMTGIRKSSLEAISKLAKKRQEGETLRKQLELKRVGLDEDDHEYVRQMYELKLKQERELKNIISTPSTADLSEVADKYLLTEEEYFGGQE